MSGAFRTVRPESSLTRRCVRYRPRILTCWDRTELKPVLPAFHSAAGFKACESWWRLALPPICLARRPSSQGTLRVSEDLANGVRRGEDDRPGSGLPGIPAAPA